MRIEGVLTDEGMITQHYNGLLDVCANKAFNDTVAMLRTHARPLRLRFWDPDAPSSDEPSSLSSADGDALPAYGGFVECTFEQAPGSNVKCMQRFCAKTLATGPESGFRMLGFSL